MSDLYTDYEEAVNELVTENDPTVALYNAWVDGQKDWDTWNALNYWGITNSATGNPGTDPVHPSNLGHTHMADKLMEIAG